MAIPCASYYLTGQLVLSDDYKALLDKHAIPHFCGVPFSTWLAIPGNQLLYLRLGTPPEPLVPLYCAIQYREMKCHWRAKENLVMGATRIPLPPELLVAIGYSVRPFVFPVRLGEGGDNCVFMIKINASPINFKQLVSEGYALQESITRFNQMLAECNQAA